GDYFLGGGGVPRNIPERWLHRAIVLFCLAGLGLGLWRTRRRELVAALLAIALLTLVNIIYVAEARANTRMMPLLIAAGVAGWFLWWRARSVAADASAHAGVGPSADVHRPDTGPPTPPPTPPPAPATS